MHPNEVKRLFLDETIFEYFEHWDNGVIICDYSYELHAEEDEDEHLKAYGDDPTAKCVKGWLAVEVETDCCAELVARPDSIR